MKRIEPGTMFVAPLFNGKNAYGYISFQHDDGMISLNIFDFLSDKIDAFEEAQEHELLIRDAMETRDRFSRNKINKEMGTQWHLKRKIKARNALPPKYDYVWSGAFSGKSCPAGNIYTHEIKQPISVEEKIKYPLGAVDSVDFLPLYLQGLLENKVVVLIPEVRDENFRRIKDAEYELRTPDDLGGYKVWDFYAAADTGL